MEEMLKFCRSLADNELFHSFILFLIVLSSLSMGLETVPEVSDRAGELFYWLFIFSQAVFAFEIAIRLLAYAPNFGKFFSDVWNSFDFAIVALSFVPGVGSFAIVGRLLRLLRVLRVFSVSDRVRNFINRLSESFDEACFTAVILLVLGYIFAISGYHLFAELDPLRWGTLGRAFLNVFYLALLQDVRPTIEAAISNSGLGILYFLLFYFVLLSLLLSVVNAAITQSLEEDR